MRRLRVGALVLIIALVAVAGYVLVQDDGGPFLPGGAPPDLPPPENGFTLEQNQPNPFQDVTAFIYQIPVEARVTLQVYNTLGAPVATLVDTVQASGFHQIEWDGRDRNGNRLPGGVYFYQLTSDGRQELRRLVLLP